MLRVERNPVVDDALAAALVDIWVAVTNAGGAVGLVAPTTAAEARSLAEHGLERVRAGDDDLVVAWVDGAPVGFGFLGTNAFAVARHWGWIKRLQRHPAYARAGVGTAVLEGIETAARQRHLERLALTVRGGTGRERFYLAHGYRLEARLPGRLKLGEGNRVEELHLSKRLDGGQDPTLTLAVHRLDPDLPLPAYAHDDDAGLDLHARQDVRLEPGERAVVPTGVAVAVPIGCVGLVHPRSGLAAEHGLALVNSPGTIDAGYRGEVRVVLVNLGGEAVALRRGDRIAQLLVQAVERAAVVEVDTLPATERGGAGFGSSGR